MKTDHERKVWRSMTDDVKVKAVLDELDYQKGVRGKSDSVRWQAYAIVKHRADLLSRSGDSPVPYEHLYDMTGVQAFETFISGFMDAFTPPNQDWFSPRLRSRKYPSSLPTDYGSEYMDYLRNAMKDEIDHSNFYDEKTLASKDTVCGGYSCKLIQDNPEEGRVFFKTMEPWRCWFDKDLTGNWNLFLYEYVLSGREVLEKFPDMDRSSDTYREAKEAPRKKFSMVYCITARNRIVDTNGQKIRFSKLFRKNMKFAILEICRDTEEMISESGSTYFPVVIHTIGDSGDNRYGCGLIMRYLEEFSKLNRLGYEYGLVIAKLNHGAFYVPQDMMEDFSNDPEARIPYQDAQLLGHRVDDPVDLRAASEILALQQNTVRELLYNSLFSFLTNSDKVYTATQVNALHNESYSKLAPLYGTVQNKDLDPTLQMIMKIMIDNDRLTVDEKYIGPEADTKLEFLFDSAMAQAMQAYTKSNAANVTVEALAAFMNLGVTSVIDNFDTDNMIRDVAYSGGAPSSYFVPRNRMEDSRAERRRAAEEQLWLENRVKESEIARNNAGASNLNNSGGFNGGAE